MEHYEGAWVYKLVCLEKSILRDHCKMCTAVSQQMDTKKPFWDIRCVECKLYFYYNNSNKVSNILESQEEVVEFSKCMDIETGEKGQDTRTRKYVFGHISCYHNGTSILHSNW